MNQPSSGHLPARSVSSLNTGFMEEEASEQGPTSLAIPGFGTGQQHVNYGLQAFYNNADDPWALINPGPNNQINRYPSQGTVTYYQSTYNFPDYRSVGLPSECGTQPPDSGYGSHRPQHSIASTSSVHEDDGQVDIQMVEQFGRLAADTSQLQPNLLSQPEFKHYCHDCKTRLKTRSELNKHEKRHRKPFQCDYANCPRGGQGFSTKNDLMRHKKSVHKEHEGNGNFYTCGEGTCSSKTKLWPRADNFRQHLTRVHHKELRAEDDLSSYICKPSPAREDLKGVGSSVAHLDPLSHPRQLTDQPDLFLSPSLNHDRVPPGLYGVPGRVPELLAGLPWSQLSIPSDVSIQRSETTPGSPNSGLPTVIQPSLLSGTSNTTVSETQSQDSHVRTPVEEVKSHETPDSKRATQAHGPTVSQVASTEVEMYQTDDLADDSDSTTQDDPDTSMSENMVEERPANSKQAVLGEAPNPVLEGAEDHENLMKYLASIPKELLETALRGKESFTRSPVVADEKPAPKTLNKCPDCSKIFNRPCELKKHAKRHEKPYGCTFRNCHKEFGSKNDWKRHESSQHWQLETWNCEERGCKKVCHRREGFKNHLQRDHNLENTKTLEEKLERCRMGRHCDPRFWCGFCVKIVEIEEPATNSWMRRCDHIDNHLMGKDGLEKKHRSDWKYIEDQQPQCTPEPRGQGASIPAVSTLDAIKSATRRRRASLDRNPQPQKKSKTTTYMWRCHNCVNCVNNIRTNYRCLECDHHFCSDCSAEPTNAEDGGDGCLGEERASGSGDDGTA